MKIEELRKKATVELEVPGFTRDETLKFKVKRPSLMAMASQGQIPNSLMQAAVKVSKGGKAAQKMIKDGEVNIKQIGELMEVYCRTAMVEPTYDEAKDILTDDQIITIFTFAKSGVELLNSFRTERENSNNNSNVGEIQEKTK